MRPRTHQNTRRVSPQRLAGSLPGSLNARDDSVHSGICRGGVRGTFIRAHRNSQSSCISSAHASTSKARSVQVLMSMASAVRAQISSGFEVVCLSMPQVSFFCLKKAPLATPND